MRSCASSEQRSDQLFRRASKFQTQRTAEIVQEQRSIHQTFFQTCHPMSTCLSAPLPSWFEACLGPNTFRQTSHIDLSDPLASTAPLAADHSSGCGTIAHIYAFEVPSDSIPWLFFPSINLQFFVFITFCFIHLIVFICLLLLCLYTPPFTLIVGQYDTSARRLYFREQDHSLFKSRIFYL